jgi:opacity protein-like surface antigen
VKRTIIVKVLYAVLVIVVMMPAALWAQGTETPLTFQKPYYGVLKLGEYIPQSGYLTDQNAQNGFSGQVAFGYYPIPYFAVEAGFGYFETRGSVNNVDRKYSAWPLEMSGRLALPVAFLEPYLLAGLGAYFTRSEIGNLGKESIEFGYFGGGGLNFNLGKSYFIGAEARYLVLKIPVVYVNPLATGTTYQTTVNIDGVTVMGQFGFRW